MVHEIDPIFLTVFGWPLRWYGLMYSLSVLFCLYYARFLLRRCLPPLSGPLFDALLIWIVVGVVVGGRLGYVILYDFHNFIQHPFDVFLVWQGGMSFHGGLVGVILAIVHVARKFHVNPLRLSDLVSTVVPIGLLLGRIGNFINGEHFGRATDASWGMIFQGGGPILRHPSQLYEAGLEGLCLLLLMAVAALKWQWGQFPGRLSGFFLITYGVARFVGELYRVPDGYVGPLTLGQFFTTPMFILGFFLIWHSWYRAEVRKEAQESKGPQGPVSK